MISEVGIRLTHEKNIATSQEIDKPQQQSTQHINAQLKKQENRQWNIYVSSVSSQDQNKDSENKKAKKM